jgi:hypothetical protein
MPLNISRDILIAEAGVVAANLMRGSPDRALRTVAVAGRLVGRRTDAEYGRMRKYLTPAEVELLIATAKKRGRYGQRDALAILMCYRHGLRVSELVALRWSQIAWEGTPRLIAELEQAAMRRGQGRVASGRALPARRLRRHQPGSVCRACRRLLQPARHGRAVDQRGQGAIKWTRLSCRTFAANAVRLQLHALAYNLGNFMRTLAMPKAVEPWSLTSLRKKLIKIGAKVVSHGRYVTFQMARVAVVHILYLSDCLTTTILAQPTEITQFIFGQPLSATRERAALGIRSQRRTFKDW